RVAQEALANVARHARATHVTVSLNSANGQMELTIQDDGAGFDPQQSSSGMGTANMRARAEELGGKLDLSSHPEQGTMVKFSIPSKARAGRNRQAQSSLQWLAVLLCWFALAMSSRWRHWAFAPALTYIAILAVVHYSRMARLDHTA